VCASASVTMRQNNGLCCYEISDQNLSFLFSISFIYVLYCEIMCFFRVALNE